MKNGDKRQNKETVKSAKHKAMDVCCCTVFVECVFHVCALGSLLHIGQQSKTRG